MHGETPRARLVIADDHDMVRAGIRAMLAGEPDLEVVGEAANGREALELCRSLKPDLVLMDVRMPEMDGLAATRKIKAELPGIAVLIVTTHESQDYLLDAITAGAAGYVLKESTREQLADAARKVLGGDSPLEGKLAMQLLRRLSADEDGTRRAWQPPADLAAHNGRTAPAGPLTVRELDVLGLLATGKTNRQIAADLHLSLSTVKGHLERIISKLGVSDRTQAAVKAIEMGLVERPRPGR